MPTYELTAINVHSFSLGESDKVLTLFSAERGLSKAVAKGARKPGSKISGRAEVLNVNKLVVNTGRSLDIISQAESVETFKPLRQDLRLLSIGLYFAELTNQFGDGLEMESDSYLQFLVSSLRNLASGECQPLSALLQYELELLQRLGLKPELDACISCRRPITDANLSVFDHESGGMICDDCFARTKGTQASRQSGMVRESGYGEYGQFTFITPMVWKQLIMAGSGNINACAPPKNSGRSAVQAHKLIKSYIEYRSGKRTRSLDLIDDAALSA